RAVFVMPWRGQTMVGTTEQPYVGDPAAVAPLAGDADYLLAALAHYFPAMRGLTPSDVTASFAGLRVLPRSHGTAFQRSRETLLPVDRALHPRWLGIYGGKLTAYRATADKVMAKLASSLPHPLRVIDTRQVILPDAEDKQ
ncbi:MAG: FAD-dependent oxidoreductase, partial [Gammaproteobacteria bacterium]|nr:FAD-dependent oxidoreductase [Gammaproteobacteria bacterium]